MSTGRCIYFFFNTVYLCIYLFFKTLRQEKACIWNLKQRRRKKKKKRKEEEFCFYICTAPKVIKYSQGTVVTLITTDIEEQRHLSVTILIKYFQTKAWQPRLKPSHQKVQENTVNIQFSKHCFLSHSRKKDIWTDLYIFLFIHKFVRLFIHLFIYSYMYLLIKLCVDIFT